MKSFALIVLAALAVDAKKRRHPHDDYYVYDGGYGGYGGYGDYDSYGGYGDYGHGSYGSYAGYNDYKPLSSYGSYGYGGRGDYGYGSGYGSSYGSGYGAGYGAGFGSRRGSRYGGYNSGYGASAKGYGGYGHNHGLGSIGDFELGDLSSSKSFGFGNTYGHGHGSGYNNNNYGVGAYGSHGVGTYGSLGKSIRTPIASYGKTQNHGAQSNSFTNRFLKGGLAQRGHQLNEKALFTCKVDPWGVTRCAAPVHHDVSKDDFSFENNCSEISFDNNEHSSFNPEVATECEIPALH